MVSTSNGFGFKATGQLGGGTPRAKRIGVPNYGGQVGFNGISPTDTNPIYRNQAVFITTSGFVTRAATNTAVGVGVLEGAEWDDASGRHIVGLYWPGTAGATNIQAYVYMDPQIEFVVQVDGALATPQAVIGATASISATNTNTGSTANGVSQQMLSATYSTSSTGQFQVTGIQATQDNALTDAFPIVTCKIAQPVTAAANNGQ